MAVSIEHLYTADQNPYHLSVCAGENGIHNIVNWIYMLEDESIVHYFKGGELVVTTGMRHRKHPHWLLSLAIQLHASHAAGLIVNTGTLVPELPQELITYCNSVELPLLTMPWEMRITDMTQSFCIRIIDSQQEGRIHDQAIRDAILRRENESEYREILATYYNLEADFTVLVIYAKFIGDEKATYMSNRTRNLPTLLGSRLHRVRKQLNSEQTVMSLVSYENLYLVVLNQAGDALIKAVQDAALETCQQVMSSHDIYMGVGIRVNGLSELYKSYQRAATAMRMAVYRNTPLVEFEKMGFYKILFSVKDDQILYAYADEILRPLDEYDSKNHDSISLLKAYIDNDRSLEQTAEALFLHRNTVNYRIQKMKELLNNPLKTVNDLFPYKVALAIRDMRSRSEELKRKDTTEK